MPILRQFQIGAVIDFFATKANPNIIQFHLFLQRTSAIQNWFTSSISPIRTVTLMQIAIYLWPIMIMFIVIILLAACIICVAIQDSKSSRPRSYVREGPRDPWAVVPESHLDEPAWEPSQYQVDVLVCSCGKWNAPNQTTCRNCNAALANLPLKIFTFETAERCAVCSFWVYPGEPIILCPSCQAQGHRAHMLEYFKSKGHCPFCKERLGTHQLLNTVPIIGSHSE